MGVEFGFGIVAACYNEFIGGFLKNVRARRKIAEALRDKDKEARIEAATIRDIAAEKGVGVKGRLGVLGDPAVYQVKVSGDRLQIHYTGPSHTTATIGIPTTLDYILDVTRKGDQLIGEAHSKATSSYRGQTATVSFTQQLTLNR